MKAVKRQNIVVSIVAILLPVFQALLVVRVRGIPMALIKEGTSQLCKFSIIQFYYSNLKV